MLFNVATTVRHVSEKEGENEVGREALRGWVDRVIAGAGWHRLMGFEDSGVTPRDLTARLPRIMNPPPPRSETDLFRCWPPALADDFESSRQKKKKKGEKVTAKGPSLTRLLI